MDSDHPKKPRFLLFVASSCPPSSSLASLTKLPKLAPLPEQLATSRRCYRVSLTGMVGMRVQANLEVAGAAVGQVTEVNKDTFWPIVEAAGEKVVVLDMYTQWCGPCKVISSNFQSRSEKYLDVVFLKLDCNQENRTLAKELGIKVVPTFKIVKNGKVVMEVTGAKLDDLILAIEAAQTI